MNDYDELFNRISRDPEPDPPIDYTGIAIHQTLENRLSKIEKELETVQKELSNSQKTSKRLSVWNLILVGLTLVVSIIALVASSSPN